MAHINSDILRLGVDVGSTTVKAVALDPADNSVLFTRYQRHNAHQADTVRQLLEEAAGHFPGMRFRIGVCGSGGRPIAAALGACYVQEVEANAAAVRALYPEVRTAVELGGQDAKVIFFRYDEASGKLQTSDMRMNGSCAGGTGAFIDEIATLLNVPADEFEQLAARGKTVYSISGRCGVFAKSDVQPLINQGARTEDIAASIYKAVVNQTIAGLAQGRPIKGNILYLGGPLTFSSVLRKSFDEALGVTGTCPENSLLYVALGAALYADKEFDLSAVADALDQYAATATYASEPPLFANKQEYEEFHARHMSHRVPHVPFSAQCGPVHIGIDSGSTTVKLVVVDEKSQILYTNYQPNLGLSLIHI